MISKNIAEILEHYYQCCHTSSFIDDDPISIPHRFSRIQDQEITGLFAAILSWGLRKTIIQNCHKLVELMDGTPYDFVLNHSEQDLKPLEKFVHRTFNSTDLLSMIAFFKQHYQQSNTLETAFTAGLSPEELSVENALIHFHQYFFSLETSMSRTKKHLSLPLNKSTCKRLNMYLRWMVRKDDAGIDFGIWQTLQPKHLLCPLDVHVERHARKLGLLTRPQTDWKAVLELTENLKSIDPNDPVRFDFALFGMGILEKKGIILSA